MCWYCRPVLCAGLDPFWRWLWFADLKYPPGYLARYAALDLAQIRHLASQDDARQYVSDVAFAHGQRLVNMSLTFEEFLLASTHFPILGLGTTLLLEAMDPERAMATRRFGDRSVVGKTWTCLSCLSRTDGRALKIRVFLQAQRQCLRGRRPSCRRWCSASHDASVSMPAASC